MSCSATPEAIVLYGKSRKSFMKDGSLAQIVLVGSMDDANVELTATCDSAKSIWEKLLSVNKQSNGNGSIASWSSFSGVKKMAMMTLSLTSLSYKRILAN
ncbi:hypothetical protein AVEN_226285-1 [Araneus ventricosus]|uniref:Uncharacterized protein n=1 Tax=Araneus ventricosus TaxID=182803 RepID=A0A4Y2D9B8_ARAVE|nr:hypothetical protein AVEN_226285-1 [Araneus ventricosus]